MKASEKQLKDTKWIFLNKGACSNTMFYILNHEFDNPLEIEERAADTLAGGIMLQGYQCGFLWGATMAVGAEAHKRHNSNGGATALAIKATQHIVDSFTKRAKSTDCYDITQSKWTSKLGMAKYFVTGKLVTCFKLANRWAPEAIRVAKEGLSAKQDDLPQNAISCASEVVRKMGGSENDMAIVAGFAGGVGLSGGGCGALSAAIWMNSKKWCAENDKKSSYPNPRAKETLEVFMKAADYEFECPKICGQKFNSIEEHTDFVKNGGCAKLIDALAKS